MRRLLWTLALVQLLCLTAGCKHTITTGRCDCECDDLCASRQPWLFGSTGVPSSNIIAPVAK